jgi:hypothetical protein
MAETWKGFPEPAGTERIARVDPAEVAKRLAQPNPNVLCIDVRRADFEVRAWPHARLP